jgi:AraC-like DNA-binding protein
MRAVTEMRAAIDGFAARYAARRVAEGADKRPLLHAFRQLQQAAAGDDYRRMAQTDRDLHLAIVRLAGVDGLVDVWESAARTMERFRVESIRVCWPDLNVLFEAHRPIVDAVCAGDQVLAEDAARAHLDAVWYRLAESKGDASLPDDPLARACTYLDFHLQESIRLGFLAKYVAKTSPGHLSRLFRRAHGLSFTDYLRELRMQKAARLLLGSSRPVGRIAAVVGYRDASRFAQHFRRRFGLSPRPDRRGGRLPRRLPLRPTLPPPLRPFAAGLSAAVRRGTMNRSRYRASSQRQA